MIEAVNSVISNANLLRQGATQGGNLRPQELESVSEFPLAPYVDQISLDTNFDTAVLEIRDSDTGDVLRQFPTESTLEARQRAEATRQRAELLRSQQNLGAETSSRNESISVNEARTQTFRSVNVQAVAIAQQADLSGVSTNLGAGEARAAVAALSSGAQTAQTQTSTVSVSA